MMEWTLRAAKKGLIMCVECARLMEKRELNGRATLFDHCGFDNKITVASLLSLRWSEFVIGENNKINK